VDIAKILRFEEGYRTKPYLCSEGYVTIGYGTKLHKEKGLDPEGFCIEFNGPIAEEFLNKDVADLDIALFKSEQGGVYDSLEEARVDIIISMAYQMGVGGVMKFKNMWAALAEENYEEAAKQMLDSKWARQTPARANRHAEVMRTGSTEVYYE
jgi:lysozyme